MIVLVLRGGARRWSKIYSPVVVVLREEKKPQTNSWTNAIEAGVKVDHLPQQFRPQSYQVFALPHLFSLLSESSRLGCVPELVAGSPLFVNFLLQIQLHIMIGRFRCRARIHCLSSSPEDIADMRLIRGQRCRSRILPEILCEIFHYYIVSFQSSTWTISQVCRAWRRIILECSILWNTIRIPSYIFSKILKCTQKP